MEINGTDIEIICRNKMEHLFMASLISSDNILSIKDAEKSLGFIDDVEKAVEESNISNTKKDEFRNYIKKGKEILKTDIKRFKEN